MAHKNGIRFLQAFVAILLAAASIFLIAAYAASPEFHAGTISSLDRKSRTVLELAAASTAASAAISFLPGDAATPIADKLAELSSYFLIVISAIYLEKYLTTITGYAAFVVLIPAACVLFAADAFARKLFLRRIAWKLMVFGLAVAIVIPASVKVSDMIDDTYNASIQTTISSAMQTTEDLESAEQSTEGGLGNIISGVKDVLGNTGEQLRQVLNRFIDALAVMIVTSCLIPILVIVFFVWIVKILIGSDLERLRMPLPPPHGGHGPREARGEHDGRRGDFEL